MFSATPEHIWFMQALNDLADKYVHWTYARDLFDHCDSEYRDEYIRAMRKDATKGDKRAVALLAKVAEKRMTQ